MKFTIVTQPCIPIDHDSTGLFVQVRNDILLKLLDHVLLVDIKNSRNRHNRALEMKKKRERKMYSKKRIWLCAVTGR